MNNNHLTEKIRKRSFEVFQYYVGSKYPNGSVSTKIKISNPLIDRRQETPSFRIFKAYDGSYLFTDYSDSPCIGDCITFLQKLKGISRAQAINEIKKVINLNY